jgi:hypothetical protein
LEICPKVITLARNFRTIGKRMRIGKVEILKDCLFAHATTAARKNLVEQISLVASATIT